MRVEILGYKCSLEIQVQEGSAAASQTMVFGGAKKMERDDLPDTVAKALKEQMSILGGVRDKDEQIAALEKKLAGREKRIATYGEELAETRQAARAEVERLTAEIEHASSQASEASAEVERVKADLGVALEYYDEIRYWSRSDWDTLIARQNQPELQPPEDSPGEPADPGATESGDGAGDPGESTGLLDDQGEDTAPPKDPKDKPKDSKKKSKK